MMSWHAWCAPEGWPRGAPSVRCQNLVVSEGHEVSLWLFDLDRAEADEGTELTACLSSEEQARAQRLRQRLHGARYRVAHAMLRRLLGHLTQRLAIELSWQVGPHGKPELAASGAADAAIRFNLSHSGNWALLATSTTLALGVDLEERHSRQHLADMAARILSDEERAPLAALPSPELTDHLLRTWTRKEACLKALGVGLTREMDTLTLQASHARTAQAHLVTQGALPELAWRDIELPADCAAWAALAWCSPV